MGKAEAAIVQRYEIQLTTAVCLLLQMIRRKDEHQRASPTTAPIKLHRFEGPYGVCMSWGRQLCKRELQVKPQKAEKEQKTKIGTKNKGNE